MTLAIRMKMRTEERKRRSRYGLNDRQREAAEKLRMELITTRMAVRLVPQKARV